MIDNHKCQICTGSSLSYLYKGIDRCYYVKGEFDLYRCNTCGLIFTFPVPGEEALKEYYPDDYYSYATADSKDTEKVLLGQKALFYLKHPLKALNCILYSKLLRQKDALCYKKWFKVLDIGCGDGRYLIDKRRYGCDCSGIDISRKALDRLKKKDSNVRTYCGNLSEAGLANDLFDVVNLENVLEHLREPEKVLNEIRRIMKDGAVLRVFVPNAASLTHKIFRKYWMGLETPRHVNTFSVRNLKLLFENTGFKIKRYRTIENSYGFICSAIHLLNAVLKKGWKVDRCSKVWDSEILKLLFFPYALIVNALKIGDSVEFILQKENKR